MLKQTWESMGKCAYTIFSLWIFSIGTLLPPLHSNVIGIVLSHTRGFFNFFFFFFLGHHEEEKKKLVTVLLSTRFLRKKTGKKGKKITRESAFKVFSCVCGWGCLWVLQNYSMYFFHLSCLSNK
jgi:hypothetical protein